jgi:hypothetical protein
MIARAEQDIPKVLAIRYSGGVYWRTIGCPYCGQGHLHGGLGVRLSHCSLIPRRLYELVSAREEMFRARDLSQGGGGRPP